MKVASVSRNLNSSYIYFKANSNIRSMSDSVVRSHAYDISKVFNANINDQGVKGICGNNKYYSLYISKDDAIQIWGTVDSNPVYIRIIKRPRFLGIGGNTGISGGIGGKKFDLTCKTNCGTKQLKGKYGNEEIEVALWDSFSTDSSRVSGELIDMDIDKNKSIVSGKSSINPTLLPVLTALLMVKDNL